MGHEHGRSKRFNLLLDVGADRSKPRILPGEGRGVDPAAEATILCADVRPYRESAAAASDKDGRGVGHGRGYKAAAPRRQGLRSSDSMDQRNAIGISSVQAIQAPPCIAPIS